MYISSHIALDVKQDASPYHTEANLKALESALTFPNPKWEETNRLGFSTWAIPKTICLIDMTNEGIWFIPRGHIRTVLNYFPNEALLDHTTSSPNPYILYYNTDFDLDIRQKRCLAAMKQKNQGIILAATSSGKSAIILKAIALKRQNTLVIVNRQVLLEQLLEDAEKYLGSATIGVLNGKYKEVGEVTFAIDKTLEKLLKEEDAKAELNPWSHHLLRNKFGMVIVDEVHIAACPTMKAIMSRLPAKYRYGLTGSLDRKDGMQFVVRGIFGDVIATISADELKDAGRITSVTPVVHNFESINSPDYSHISGVEKWKMYDNHVHTDKARLRSVAEIARSILIKNKDARILILFRYIAPCKEMAAILSGFDIAVGVVVGENKDNTETLNQLEDGKVNIVCSTIGISSTGINVKTLTDIILFSPVLNNESLLTQCRGRLMRKSPGKQEAFFHIVWDKGVYPEFRLNRIVRQVKI